MYNLLLTTYRYITPRSKTEPSVASVCYRNSIIHYYTPVSNNSNHKLTSTLARSCQEETDVIWRHMSFNKTINHL